MEWWRALSTLPTQQPLSTMKAQVMFPVQRDKISKNTNVDMCVRSCAACVYVHNLSTAIVLVTLLTLWLLVNQLWGPSLLKSPSLLHV